ncbi:MAG: hypothetical protein JO015_13415 [Verrucomicrobia bacterium]|nr:hypothetical protein [Verrucomicrobiota bacterium]
MSCHGIRKVRRAAELLPTFFSVMLVIAAVRAQTPAIPRQDRSSPDQRYEWRVDVHDPVRYELVEAGSGRVLATVRDYFSDQGHALAVRHARGAGVYWNDRSTLVALDEFNFRRAGRLYLFWIQNGKARPIPFDGLITSPAGATEARFCVQHGWESATQLSIRLAAQLSSGEVISKGYLIDVADPIHPKVQAQP